MELLHAACSGLIVLVEGWTWILAQPPQSAAIRSFMVQSVKLLRSPLFQSALSARFFCFSHCFQFNVRCADPSSPQPAALCSPLVCVPCVLHHYPDRFQTFDGSSPERQRRFSRYWEAHQLQVTRTSIILAQLSVWGANSHLSVHCGRPLLQPKRGNRDPSEGEAIACSASFIRQKICGRLNLFARKAAW